MTEQEYLEAARKYVETLKVQVMVGFDKEVFDADLDILIHEIFKIIDTYYEGRQAVEIKQMIFALIEKHFNMEAEMTESWDDSNDERRRILEDCPVKLRGYFTNLFLSPVRRGLREPQQIVSSIVQELEGKLNRWGPDENKREYLAIIQSYRIEALDFADWAVWYHSLSPEEIAARKQKLHDDFRREWMSSQPATDKQISYLRVLGYDGDVTSKQEASELITKFMKGG